MAAEIIDGRQIAKTIRAELVQEIKALHADHQVTPGLAVVLVGENPASQAYVCMKEKACKKIGIYSEQYSRSAETSEEALLQLVNELNQNPKIHGILVQLPLPDHIDEHKILNAISPDKDVDGFHPVNMGNVLIGQKGFKPCTPYGIQKILEYSGHDPAGKHVVVIGRSNIVGKPIAAMLVQKQEHANATVTICHSRTPNLSEVTRQADILIAAIGRPEMVTADMVNEDAVVIDVGSNRIEDPSAKKGYKFVGDVNFDDVSQKCKAITPSPGGVGPMTITMLLYNTVESAKMSIA
ncbi:bifunctional methylenetetrahydrofolate dehydrogenase/methenyltetrahydrofolate cyclohydrolase FolD [candidate division KSB3 bacterium]|uniref:Bifunctional protein FolD n=1 Tax=candidate division KSB3 bacterium TaxID=2044937 RepID=A0A2G6KCE3_9BACT|nr:MAG: bifunctional methylenetetrahydrofolate dehydrogenase/methenyltetrahydrofolate cyclohydrolase FolD [candidate division KSB3 bacterium]